MSVAASEHQTKSAAATTIPYMCAGLSPEYVKFVPGQDMVSGCDPACPLS